jgi:hypothetical protein
LNGWNPEALTVIETVGLLQTPDTVSGTEDVEVVSDPLPVTTPPLSTKVMVSGRVLRFPCHFPTTRVVTVIVAVANFPLGAVTVIAALPTPTAVTRPPEVTVATPIFEDCHAGTAETVAPAASLKLAVSCLESPTNMLAVEAARLTLATSGAVGSPQLTNEMKAKTGIRPGFMNGMYPGNAAVLYPGQPYELMASFRQPT